MLQVDPTLTKLTKARKRSLASALSTIGLLAALLFFAGRRFFKPVFPFISSELWWFPALIVFFFLALQLSAAQEGFLRRVELRRQATAQGDTRFLAKEQPQGNADALPLPTIVRLRPDNLSILSGFALPSLVLFGGWVLYRWLTHAATFSNASFWTISGIFVFVLLTIVVTLYWQVSTEFLQVIEVSDEGLRTRYKGQESSIRWNEARFFAFYGVFGDRRGRGTQTYELSGRDIVVKWTEYQRKNRMWYLKKRCDICRISGPDGCASQSDCGQDRSAILRFAVGAAFTTPMSGPDLSRLRVSVTLTMLIICPHYHASIRAITTW